jgi:hypothetical protein
MAASWTSLAGRSVSSVQLLTEAAPTGLDGIPLADVLSVVPIIHAEAGQTISGGGSLLGYVKANGLWVRAPHSDLLLDTVVGLTHAALPTLNVTSPRDRFALIANGVTVSGGTTVTLELFCVSRSGLEIL